MATMSNQEEILDIIENDEFLMLSKKALETLENLLDKNQITPPIEPQVLLDIAIGAVAESQMTGKVKMIDIFVEHSEFLFDKLLFEQTGEYTIHDVLSQVVCFRIISLMEEYLDHLEIEYVSSFEESDE
jgi:hypothetical protein